MTPVVPIVYGMNGVVQQVRYATYNQDSPIATIVMVVPSPRDPGPTEGTKTLPIFLNRLKLLRVVQVLTFLHLSSIQISSRIHGTGIFTYIMYR